MQLTMKISRDDDGQYRALCPELGISTRAADRRGAADRLTSMILDFLVYDADVQALGDDDAGAPSMPRDGFAMLNGDDGVKLLVIPRRSRAN
jgi:hypothetical protein